MVKAETRLRRQVQVQVSEDHLGGSGPGMPLPRCPRLSLSELGYALSWEGNTALGEVLSLVEDNSKEEHAAEESANNCPGAGGIGSSSVLTTHHSTHMLSALGTSLTLLTLCPDLQPKGVTPTSWDTQKSKGKNKNKRKQCVNCEQGYSFQPEFWSNLSTIFLLCPTPTSQEQSALHFSTKIYL